MSQYKYAEIADTVYFWFAANTTAGAAGDGATPLYDVRLAGAAAGAIPTASGTPTLLTHANYTDGLHEIAIDTTGYAAGEYAVFCTLTISTVNPAGFCGSFKLRTAGTAALAVDTVAISGDATAANNAESFFDGTGYAGTNNVIPTVTTLTNLPAITSNWLTAAGINAGALDGKGNWNIGKTGYSLTAGTGLGNQTSNITGNLSGSVGSVTGSVGSVTGAVGSVTGAVGSVTAAVTVGTNNDKTGYELSATGITAIWAEVVTGTTTAVQAMRGFIAAMLGKASGLPTAPKYRNIADTKNVISATTDENGNRTAVTVDLT